MAQCEESNVCFVSLSWFPGSIPSVVHPANRVVPLSFVCCSQVISSQNDRSMKKVKMRDISTILRDFLNMSVDVVSCISSPGPRSILNTTNFRRSPQRITILSIIPNKNLTINLHARPGFCASIGRDRTLSVGNVDTFAIFSSEFPTVEGALKSVAFNGSTTGDVGSQVRAVSIQNVGFSIFTTEHSKVITQSFNILNTFLFNLS
mmetsp:Transcript_36692/g.57622  ORF Transcript_36692/g.57622 Transcript_36692/m.57622 type:complete len:205 (+) Transcript_36692:534-1148(+)